MTKKLSKATRNPRQTAKDRHRIYYDAVSGAIDALELSDADAATMNAMLGRGGHCERMLCSDAPLNYHAAKLLDHDLEKIRQANPDYTFYLATFIDDDFTTSDRSPVVGLTALTEKVRRAVAKINLPAIVKIEKHALMNHPGGGAGRSLLFHAHAILWADAKVKFDHVAAARALNTSRNWKCSFEAKPVDIRPIGSTAVDLARVAFYIMKQPYSAKNVMADKRKPGGVIFMDTIEGYRDELKLRVFEGDSQIDLFTAMFGVGAGKSLVRSICSELSTWHKARARHGRTFLEHDFDPWIFWHDIRKDHGSNNYRPYLFDTAFTSRRSRKKTRGTTPPPPRPPRTPRPGASWRRSASRPHQTRRTLGATLRARRDS